MSGIVGNNTHRPLSIDEFRAFYYMMRELGLKLG